MKAFTPCVRDTNRSRRGAVMVFALIALLVGSLMIAALLKTAAMSHRQLKRDENRLQASFLADAGCDRVRMLLRSQPDFTSGEWNVLSSQLAPNRAARIRMTVTEEPGEPSQRIVTAVAEYPIDHPDLVRVTRQIRVR